MSLMLSLALLCGVSLASAGLSFFVLYRARSLVYASEQRAQAGMGNCESSLQLLQLRIEELSGQIEELKRQPAVSAGVPRPGLNLSKRSQALRMHRRGEPAGQIAASLEIPLQEVDLLLKVHRIVMSNI